MKLATAAVDLEAIPSTFHCKLPITAAGESILWYRAVSPLMWGIGRT